MIHGADARSAGEAEERTGTVVESQDASLLSIRNRLSGVPQQEDPLVRRLAADHLRELRDDGVTFDYIARMYGVSPERMEILFGELVPSPPR